MQEIGTAGNPARPCCCSPCASLVLVVADSGEVSQSRYPGKLLAHCERQFHCSETQV